MGQRTYDESRKKWLVEGFYPTCKLGALEPSSNTKIEVNRGDDWYCAMHKLDKKTGKREILNPETKKAATLYVSLSTYMQLFILICSNFMYNL